MHGVSINLESCLQGDALYAMELALSLEKLNFTNLRQLHAVADKHGDAAFADFVEGALLDEQVRCSVLQLAVWLLAWLRSETPADTRLQIGGPGFALYCASASAWLCPPAQKHTIFILFPRPERSLAADRGGQEGVRVREPAAARGQGPGRVHF